MSDESGSCGAVGGITEVVTDSSLIAIMEHVPAASMSTGAADVIRVETANDGDEVYASRDDGKFTDGCCTSADEPEVTSDQVRAALESEEHSGEDNRESLTDNAVCDKNDAASNNSHEQSVDLRDITTSVNPTGLRHVSTWLHHYAQ